MMEIILFWLYACHCWLKVEYEQFQQSVFYLFFCFSYLFLWYGM